ncbi:uncharacterized protein N7482_001697 [Penicillium canariense]|uniref:Major facilitator superfamily (MFS) profile domain-containing protein n=1 Tax=Penicillium canariense TaxID=189055 RepID=A0A9W9LTT7_9EURO|nr:uncharacterized protein N7482_001697 [Penicillium canariense]KAJ5175820.1 hypothetical protein N7482_001697 [Penicillium canariense]
MSDHQHSDEPGPSGPNQLKAKQEAMEKGQSEEKPLVGPNLALLMAALISSMFLVALDRTIIATAVPKISDHFHAIDDISWYASAYLLTSSATQLIWGRIYTFYSAKILFLTAIVVFEMGSALCGAAPNSKSFIVGRAIAGMGSAGIFNGSTVIISQVVPLHKRPMYIGLMGSTFGVSSIVGPLLGGVFTDRVTWRWCFYINLPIGGIALIIIAFSLQEPSRSSTTALKRQLIRLDPLGTVLFLPGVICLLLALQWGGTTYGWSNTRIIVLLLLAGILLAAFGAVQAWCKDDATIPPRIIKQRSVAFGAVYTSCISGAMISMLYTLPLWFQGVKGTSAVQSGLDTIPMVLSLVVASILSGATISRTGYYVPFMFIASLLMATSSGMITTFKTETGHSAWIGYQALFGLGLGSGMQQPTMAAQTVLDQADVPIGVALMFLFQSLGGAVWVAVSQNLYTNYIATELPSISGINPEAILAAGATELAKLVPADKLHAVLVIYNAALHRAFFVPVALSCVMILPALGMEWRNVKRESEKREKEKLSSEKESEAPIKRTSDVEKII